MTDQFQPLTLTTRQRVDRLTRAQISKPDILQQLQTSERMIAIPRLRQLADELHNFINRCVQQIGNRPRPTLDLGPWTLDFDFQNVLAIPPPAALRARHK